MKFTDTVSNKAAAPVSMGRVQTLKDRYGRSRKALNYLAMISIGRSLTRNNNRVMTEYDRPDRDIEWNSLDTPWVAFHKGDTVIAQWADGLRSSINILNLAINEIGASTIMEVGCGEGINVGFYSKLFPEQFDRLTWQGFDLAPERVNRAVGLFEQLSGHTNTKFWSGDATTKQVEPLSVDLAYSVHAIEQIEDGWKDAIAQMGKASKHVLLIEPFYERKSIYGKLHSRYNGYFKGKISEVLDLGFELVREYPVEFKDPFNPSTALLLKSVALESL
jgi:hypothetical protein